MTPNEMRNEKLADKVVKNLKKRHFEAYYCKTKEEAASLALSLIPEKDTVSWGGSESIRTIGLTAMVHNGDYTVMDRDLAGSVEERMEIQRKALLSDTFLMSANGISEDGELVNIDGNGNRVAALCFGPKNVIVVAGMNKIVKTPEDAMKRARTIAAPINAQRFEGINTGCMVTGACEACSTTDCICCYLVTTRVCRPAGKIKVILVGENLGF